MSIQTNPIVESMTPMEVKQRKRLQYIEAQKSRIRTLIVEGSTQKDKSKILEAIRINRYGFFISDYELLILAGCPFKLIAYNTVSKVGKEYLSDIRCGSYQNETIKEGQYLVEYLLLNDSTSFYATFSRRTPISSVWYNGREADISLHTLKFFVSDRDNKTEWKTKDVLYILREIETALNVFDAWQWFENEANPQLPF